MDVARTLRPWIAYAIASALVDWRLGAALALVVAAGEVHRQQREHGGADALTVATRWAFLALTVLAVAQPDTPLHRYTPALSLGVLGATAAWTLLAGEPFTAEIARRSTPEAVWGLPEFHRANVAITTAWALSMLVAAAGCAAVLALAPSATALWVAIQVLGFIVPAAYTTAYRNQLRQRMLQPA